MIKDHLKKLCDSQQNKEWMQAHYLSPERLNDFIKACGDVVRNVILQARKSAKYFAIIVDSTPGVSHLEQTTFIIRYALMESNQYFIKERFLLTMQIKLLRISSK